MKIYILNRWLVAGAAVSSLIGCQAKPKNEVPAPRPPEAPYEDKVPCREEECDEEEAGEEAMIHVIEIDSPEEESASVKDEKESLEPVTESTSSESEQKVTEAAPAEPEQKVTEMAPAESEQKVTEMAPAESEQKVTEMAPAAQDSAQTLSDKPSESVEVPSILEEPTTKSFEGQLPEKSVVLSVI